MKIMTLLFSLCLVGLLAKPTEAGFVSIDDFTNVSAPDGVADSRSLIGIPATTSVADGKVSGSPESLVLLSFEFNSPYDFSSNPIFELAGVNFGASGSPTVSNVTATAQLNGGTSVLAVSSVPVTGGKLSFDFTGAAELAGVSLLRFALTPSPALSQFSFSIDRVQAVPEPATWLLLGAGGIAACVFYRRRRRVEAMASLSC